MSRIRFLWDNKLDIATLVPSSEVSSLPAKNIQHPHRKLVWRTATGRDLAEGVLINLGAAYTVKGVALINHNLGITNPSERLIRLLGSSRNRVFYQLSEYSKACWLWYGDGNDWANVMIQNLTSRGTGNTYALRSDKGACAVLNGSGWFRRLDADCGAGFDFGTGDFTLKAWIKTSTAGKDIYSKWLTSPETGVNWSLLISGVMKLAIADGTNIKDVLSNTQVNNNAQHFIALVVDRTGGKAHFYLDGNWNGQDLDISNVTGSVNCNEPLIIGAMDDIGTNAWIGSIGAMTVEKGIARTKANLDADYAGITVAETLIYDPEIIIKNFTGTSNQFWLLEMRDPDNADDCLEIGRVFLGDYFEPSRQFARGWEEMLIDPSRVEQSEQGQEWVDLKEKHRLIRVEFPEGAPLSDADREKYREMLKEVGCSKDLFIALDYDNDPNKLSLYGKFAQTEFNFREFLNGLFSTGFDFKESR